MAPGTEQDAGIDGWLCLQDLSDSEYSALKKRVMQGAKGKWAPTQVCFLPVIVLIK